MTQVYNYLQTAMPSKRYALNPARSRDELKKIYNNIVELSKSSPYYMINISRDNQDYALGIKEAALEMKDRLNEMNNPQVSNFDSKEVINYNEDVLSASLIGEDVTNLPTKLQFEVKNLATIQENKGKELMNESWALPQATYLFDVNVAGTNHSLIFVNEKRRANREVMEELTAYLNESVPGINASVEDGQSRKYSYIKIEAEKTGKTGEIAFSFRDNEIHDSGIVDHFGLNRVEKEAINASFDLNGAQRMTTTNSFVLENTLYINLKKESDLPTLLRIAPNSEKINDTVESVLSSYNKLINLAQSRSQSYGFHYNASKLIVQMKNLEEVYGEELDACGIKANEDGTLYLEEQNSIRAARDGRMEELFNKKNGFIARLKDKMEAITINPMDYLEKTVVLYPNTEKINFTNPYVTSMYSGMLFNSYC